MTLLQTTLALEIAAGQSIILIPAQSSLPATWEQSFSTFFDNQQAFDLHLLTEQAGESNSLGRWQVTGLPALRRGALEIQVKISVDRRGSVTVTATLEGRALKTTCLTGSPANLPVKEASSRSMTGDKPPSLANRTHTAPEGLNQLDAEKKEFLRQRGFEISSDGRLVQGKQPVKKGLFGRQVKKIAELSPQEIVELAGEPLTAEESQRCPNPRCGATIPRQSKRCAWCGQKLNP